MAFFASFKHLSDLRVLELYFGECAKVEISSKALEVLLMTRNLKKLEKISWDIGTPNSRLSRELYLKVLLLLRSLPLQSFMLDVNKGDIDINGLNKLIPVMNQTKKLQSFELSLGQNEQIGIQTHDLVQVISKAAKRIESFSISV